MQNQLHNQPSHAHACYFLPPMYSNPQTINSFALSSELYCLIKRSFNSWSSSIKNAPTPHKALQIFSHMHRKSIPIDTFSALYTLKSSTYLKNLSIIRHLHAHITKICFNSHVYVGTALLHSYVVSSFKDACLLFDEMPDRNIVTWNMMVTGYAKVGDVEKARFFFEQMPEKNLVSWSAMIAGYVNNANRVKGLSLYREMVVKAEVKPDQVALGSVLSGCAQMGSIGLVLGKSVHAFMMKNKWELNVELGTVLVDMYAKCGFLKNATLVFHLMQDKNVMTWTSLICGLAQHGYGKEALSIFCMMQDAGVKPNEMTFTGILSACAQAGLFEEGKKYFNMIETSGLELRIQHYGCLVDLFGKAGRIDIAYEIIKTMTIEPNVIIWSSFLAACKVHKQFQMAERVFERVLSTVRPENDGGVYTLICDLYVLNEKWEDAERVRNIMVDQSVKKIRGSSFIRSRTAWKCVP